jgi:hypothetical protein
MLIHGVGKNGRGEIRHGHCIVRDHRDRVATMIWDAPSMELLRALSTNPKDQAADHAAAAAESVHSSPAEGSETA